MGGEAEVEIEVEVEQVEVEEVLTVRLVRRRRVPTRYALHVLETAELSLPVEPVAETKRDAFTFGGAAAVTQRCVSQRSRS